MKFDRDQIEKDLHELIGPLCETVAPTGFEQEMGELLRRVLAPTSLELSGDLMLNVFAHKQGRGPKVLVAAHQDEIGLIVRHIDTKGFLWVETLAGLAPQSLFGKHVIVKTESGHVDGVINHIQPGRPERCTQMPATLEEFFVDVGASSREEAGAMGIEVGNPIVMEYPTLFLGRDKKVVAGKALDDRALVFILIELCRLLDGDPDTPDFYAAFTTQEECGGRGAIVAAQEIRPDYALALDMSLATDIPCFPDRKTVNVQGGGTSIKVMDRAAFCGLIADQEVVRGLKRICKENKIPYQLEAYAKGATDASVMQTQAGGSRAGGINLPMRYVHSYETVSVNDLIDSVELLYRYVKSLAVKP